MQHYCGVHYVRNYLGHLNPGDTSSLITTQDAVNGLQIHLGLFLTYYKGAYIYYVITLGGVGGQGPLDHIDYGLMTSILMTSILLTSILMTSILIKSILITSILITLILMTSILITSVLI